MKKTIKTMLILVILVFSMIPAAFAEPSLTAISPERVIAKKVIAVENVKQVRTLNKVQKLEGIKERYNKSIAQYTKLKDNYLRAKLKVNATKTLIKECKNDDSIECNEIRKDVKRNSKDFLLKSADKVITFLGRLAERVKSSNIDDEIKEVILEDIGQDITDLEAAKDVIENLDGNSTDEEIREAAQTIKKIWRNAKIHAKKALGMLTNAKIGNIIHRAEKLEEKLGRTISRLEEQGYDVSEIEELVEDFKEKVDEAKEKYEEAKKEFQNNNIEEAHKLVKEAHRLLREAHDTLKQIFRQIKGIEQSGEEVEAEEVEAEEDEEEE